MRVESFFDNINLQYPEIAICLEDSDTGTGKFYIPILMPLLPKDVPYNTIVDNSNISNIKNKDNTPFCKMPKYTTSNYIELKVPNCQSIKKGDIFIIVFIGGDLNKIRIIGEY